MKLKIPSGKIEADNVEDVLIEWLYQIIETLEKGCQEVVFQVQKEQQKQKSQYNQKGLPEKLKIGDKVLVECMWLKTNFSSKLKNK